MATKVVINLQTITFDDIKRIVRTFNISASQILLEKIDLITCR